MFEFAQLMCGVNLTIKSKEHYLMQRKGALLTIVLVALGAHHQYNTISTLQLINMEVTQTNNYHF